MPSSIIITQGTAGTPGKTRDDLVTASLVTFSNQTVESSYLWTLTDAPIRSTLVRGTTSTAATFGLTPDVKGTYRVTLQVNGSTATADNSAILAAVKTTGDRTLGWRYPAAGEERQEDNVDYAGLNFPGDTNVRGWATPRDLQLEQTEEAAYLVLNRVTTSPGVGVTNDLLVGLDPATGQFDPSVIPGATAATTSAAIQSGVGAWTVPVGAAVGSAISCSAAFTGVLAQNNSTAALAEVVGIVAAKPTVTTATIVYAGEVSGLTGLTPGAHYHLDTGGALVTPGPAIAAGVYSTYVGQALSTTTLLVRINPTKAL